MDRLFESPEATIRRRRRLLGYEDLPPDAQMISRRSQAIVAVPSQSDYIPTIEIYYIGMAVTWVLVFVGSWILCIANYGFLFGVGLGWLPSIIVASLAAVLWPLIVVGIALIAALVLGR